jgi:iron complex outermembrane receptor protein
MKTAILLAGASLLVLAGSAAAQTPGAAAQSAPSGAAANSSSLAEVVVTAQRRTEKLKDVPLTITAVTGADLAKSGVTSVRDLQTVVSGLTFSGLGTVSQPSIRGVSTEISAGGSENPIALYVDGVYQASQAVLNEELPDVARVEVLKGPQGTLFGRNATGGAIQIFTKAPSFAPSGSFTVDTSYYDGSGGSHSSARENLKGYLTGPLINDVLAGSISAAYSGTDGYLVDQQNGKGTGRIDKENFRAKLLYTPDASTQVTLTGFYVKEDNQGLLANTPLPGLSAADAYPGSIVPTKPWHVAYDAGFFGNQLEQYGANLKIQRSFDAGTLTSLTAYGRTDTPHSDQTIAAGESTIACMANFACIDYDFSVHDYETSEELNFASRNFGIFNFTTGLFFYDSKSTTVGIIQGDLVPGGLLAQSDLTHTTAYAVYAEGTAKPTDRLAIIFGLRESTEPHNDQAFATPLGSPAAQKSKTFDSTTPRLSVKYDLTSSLNAYATYSQGYKSGLTGVTNSASIPQYASVKPETLTAYETGLKYATRQLTLDGSFFYYDYKDKQEQTFTGTSSVILNAGPVEIYGFDFDANAKLNQEFRLSANLSYIPVARYLDFPNANGQSTVMIPFSPGMGFFNCAPGGGCGGFYPGVGGVVAGTFNATGHRLIRTPTVTANSTLYYEHELASGRFDASATVDFSSLVYHDITDTIRQPAYATVNAQAGYLFRGPGVRVGAFVRNLTNQVYIVNGLTSASGFGVGYGAPREIGLTANYAF